MSPNLNYSSKVSLFFKAIQFWNKSFLTNICGPPTSSGSTGYGGISEGSKENLLMVIYLSTAAQSGKPVTHS